MSVPPATQKPWTLQTTGLSAVEQAHEAADVAAHHRVVDHRVPGRAGSWLPPCTAGSSGEPGGRLRCRTASRPAAFGARDEIVAAAEPLAVAGERDDVDLRIEVGALDARGELARHVERDAVAALGAVEGDARDAPRGLVGQRGVGRHGQRVWGRRCPSQAWRSKNSVQIRAVRRRDSESVTEEGRGPMRRPDTSRDAVGAPSTAHARKFRGCALQRAPKSCRRLAAICSRGTRGTGGRPGRSARSARFTSARVSALRSSARRRRRPRSTWSKK